MNCQKYTRNQASNILVHCNRSDPNRTYGNEQIDHSKSHLNYNLAPTRNISDFDFMKKRCEELNIFKRKDINWMVSWLVTMPQDYTGNKERFFDKSYEYMTNKYGEENVISAYVHMDETTPHLHFTFVPVVYNGKKQEYKVNAKQCITKTELQKIHTDMQNYLEKELNTNVNLLNGATKEGNKSIRQLKETSAVKEKAIKELVENPTQEIIEKVSELQLKKYNKEEILQPIKIQPLTEFEIDKLSKKECRQELKIKVLEIKKLEDQNQVLFTQNQKYSNSFYLTGKLQNKNDKLEIDIREIKEENFVLKSEFQKLAKKYNKIVDTFEYFITRIQNLLFSIQNIFTHNQKENNQETVEKIDYICRTDSKEIITDMENAFDSAEKQKRKERQKDYDMEM